MPSVTKNYPSGRDDGSQEEREGGNEDSSNKVSFAGNWKLLMWLSGCVLLCLCVLVEISLQPQSKLMNMFLKPGAVIHITAGHTHIHSYAKIIMCNYSKIVFMFGES